MNVIVTADGRDIDVEHAIGEINIYAIAWSLSQINRFNGHAARPYSVAEHCLLVVDILEQELGISDPHALLAGLMHDAHESITGDLHSPGKHVIGEPWAQWEQRFESMVRSRFALHTSSTVFREVIRRADLIALATERRDLMSWHDGLAPWPVLYGIRPVSWVDLSDATRERTPWQDWRDRFHLRFEELDFARAEVRASSDASASTTPTSTQEKA